MVTVKRKPVIRWAGVELQPDMQKPQTPVRLGIVLLRTTPAGEREVIIVGREPAIDGRPPELEAAGEMTMELATGWVHNLAKDLDVTADDPFSGLAERWRWNLYVTQPTRISGSGNQPSLQSLFALAKKKYEKFVGQPFAGRIPDAPRRDHVTLPPAWMAEAIKSQRSAPIAF
jgi:hypothetical protein